MNLSAAFVQPDVSHLDGAAFLVGYPIAHSMSPSLHHQLYTSKGKKWGQVLCETTDLSSFIEYIKTESKCMGSGVTMPFKVDVIPYLDELTPEGEAIGAINTIFIKNVQGKKIYAGTNTDCIGIRDAFLTNVKGTPYAGKPGLVVGGGGTCRAAIYSLQKFLGCSPIYVINREKSEVDAVFEECAKRGGADDLIHVSTLEQAKSLVAPGAIVSAVPDFAPVTENEKMVRSILQHFLTATGSGALLEMCYHPSPDTQISQMAESSGWQVIGGLEAMIGQGLAQAALWTGIVIDEEVREMSRNVIRAKLQQRRKDSAPVPAAPALENSEKSALTT